MLLLWRVVARRGWESESGRRGRVGGFDRVGEGAELKELGVVLRNCSEPKMAVLWRTKSCSQSKLENVIKY